MSSLYLGRTLEPILRRAARQFPAVVLTGPRQAVKTTLLRNAFPAKARYLSLEAPDVRAAAEADPRAFLAQFPPPVIFDEIQHVPVLLPYIKDAIDAHRSRTGQYLLTGSQNLALSARITESLAGRAATLRLFPMSRRELAAATARKLPWERRGPAPAAPPVSPRDHWLRILRGGYPEIATAPRRDAALWHRSYIETYLERDVRSLRQIGDLLSFRNFLLVLAARSGQLLSLTDVARDLGVAVNTAKTWLSILEATYQVLIVRPYHANINKRMVKTPKVYFTDTGTLCHLTGLRDPQHARLGPMGGTIFETAVLSEIVRTIASRGEEPRVWFWRTSAGVEVDFLVESVGTLIPIEVKLSATPLPPMANAIRTVQSDLGAKAGHGFVIHGGDVRLPLGPGVTAIPFSDL